MFASATLLSGIWNYVSSLFLTIFIPARMTDRVFFDRTEYISGRSEKNHAARYFYATIGSIFVFGEFLAGILSNQALDQGSQYVIYFAIWLASVLSIELVSLVLFSNQISTRKIYPAMVIYAVIAFLALQAFVPIGVFISAAYLAPKIIDDYFVAICQLVGLGIAWLVSTVFLATALKRNLEWKLIGAIPQALFSSTLIVVCFAVMGLLLTRFGFGIDSSQLNF